MLGNDAQASPSTVRDYFRILQDTLFARHILVSLDPYPRVVEGIDVLPWNEFLDRLWSGTLIATA